MKDKPREENSVLRIVAGAGQVTCFLIGTYLLATVLEVCGLHSWWKHANDDRIEERTRSELQHLENSIGSKLSLRWFQLTYLSIVSISDATIRPVEKHLSKQTREIEGSPNSVAAVTDALRPVQRSIYRHIVVAIEVFGSWVFRLCTLILGLLSVVPILLLCLIDGLVTREVRRWSGGYEHSWVFVFARKTISTGLVIFATIYLVWPWSLGFAWTNALMGVILGTGLFVSASRFKKYL